jgi:hypothetical protein
MDDGTNVWAITAPGFDDIEEAIRVEVRGTRSKQDRTGKPVLVTVEPDWAGLGATVFAESMH